MQTSFDAERGRDAPSALAPLSQTLSRGIRILEVLAEADGPMFTADIAAALGVHRSIAYRLLRTLEDHGLVAKTLSGAIEPGASLAALARSVSRDLQRAALPELTAIANDLGMTSFVAVRDRGEVVTLVSVEPRHARAAVAQRPGTRHSLVMGAPGVAIRAQLPALEREAIEPDESRVSALIASGHATSQDEVIPGLSAVAVPLQAAGFAPAALSVVYVATEYPVDVIAARLTAGVREIRRELGEPVPAGPDAGGTNPEHWHRS